MAQNEKISKANILNRALDLKTWDLTDGEKSARADDITGIEAFSFNIEFIIEG